MEGRSAFANLKDSKSFLLVALLILIGQYLIVTFGGEMFSVIPLPLEDWAIIIGSSSLVLWIGELFPVIQKINIYCPTYRDGACPVPTTGNSVPV